MFAIQQVSTCSGDYDGDGHVTIDELLTMVSISLETADIATCPAGDANHDGPITIDEVVAGVNGALNGCAAQALGW